MCYIKRKSFTNSCRKFKPLVNESNIKIPEDNFTCEKLLFGLPMTNFTEIFPSCSNGSFRNRAIPKTIVPEKGYSLTHPRYQTILLINLSNSSNVRI